MEKDPKKLAKADEPQLQDLVDDKKREDAARLGAKVDDGRADARSTASVQAEASEAVRRGNAVKAFRRGQYPASGPLREPGDIFPLEEEEDFSESWMTRDLEADPVEASRQFAEQKRHASREDQALRNAEAEDRRKERQERIAALPASAQPRKPSAAKTPAKTAGRAEAKTGKRASDEDTI